MDDLPMLMRGGYVVSLRELAEFFPDEYWEMQGVPPEEQPPIEPTTRRRPARIYINQDEWVRKEDQPPKPAKRPSAAFPGVGTQAVYLITAPGYGYKIGRSTDVAARMKALQSASPVKLQLLHAIETKLSARCETYLHSRFDSVRIRGEWFALSDEQVDYICSLGQRKEQQGDG